MVTWPRRPKATRRRVLRAGRPSPQVPEAPPASEAPRLVPRSTVDAWAVLLVLIGVGLVVALLVVASLARYATAGLEGRIVLSAFVIAGSFTLLLLFVSVLGYVLPRALGVRRG